MLPGAEQRKGFPESESSPGDVAVKTIEETPEGLGYDVRLGTKAAAGSSPAGEMPSNSIMCDREIEKGGQSMGRSLSYFRNLPQLPQPSAATTLIRQCHGHRSATLFQLKDYNSLRAQMTGSIF